MHMHLHLHVHAHVHVHMQGGEGGRCRQLDISAASLSKALVDMVAPTGDDSAIELQARPYAREVSEYTYVSTRTHASAGSTRHETSTYTYVSEPRGVRK